MVVISFLLLAFLSTGMGQQCESGFTGNVNTGCRNYVKCTNGVGVLVTCQDIGNGFVYNKNTGQCDDPNNVPLPCGQQKDCRTKTDGSYADMDNHCHSYYTCNRGTFFGHTICATGLVFDEASQTCNWPQNVLPPCGTKTR
ncbi:peritrophin-48-like [Argopecten irradians]|uniref:peritrophin-48-like n=1 Tax=Argopecten irradians TaxID=31199 RepID=UPI0037162932